MVHLLCRGRHPATSLGREKGKVGALSSTPAADNPCQLFAYQTENRLSIRFIAFSTFPIKITRLATEMPGNCHIGHASCGKVSKIRKIEREDEFDNSPGKRKTGCGKSISGLLE